MFAESKTGLIAILRSKNGIHLTGYISCEPNKFETAKKLDTLISETYEWLQPVMDQEARSRFLEPLEDLRGNVSELVAMQGNIGIFRNETSLRVICIPAPVEDLCVVATTFHVKPLLRWLQAAQDFHLVAVDKDSAHLFRGGLLSLNRVSSFAFDDSPSADNGTRFLHWLRSHRGPAAPDLFLMGELTCLDAHISSESRAALFADLTLSFDHVFSEAGVSEVSRNIRSLFAQRAKWAIQKSLIEFSVAEDESRVTKNIFQISKAVARGQVRKLMIASDIKVFGKIDPKTGGLALHPYHLDHEDDDILDDLAQAVIAQGGEVVVASNEEMPQSRIAMAILNHDTVVQDEVEVWRNL